MLSMEGLLGARALEKESLQMWDLNKRLEAYLARVKFLEEENEVLRAEIQRAKSSPAERSWRSRYEEELRALRATLDDAFKEKCLAELARDNLYEEVEQVRSRCERERAARDEAKRQLGLSKKELEEERRAQIWLKERAAQLEKEVEALMEIHEEDRAQLDQEVARFSCSLESFRAPSAAFQPLEVEDYSKRLAEIWKGAVETYKSEVAQLESTLGQAKESLWQAVEGNRQNQLQLQQLEKDLAGLKARKEMLEENLSQQWQEQRGEAEKFQLAIEALEQEKQALRVQIAQVLEDRQQLMHLKMSLSLEVATYRTLLEAESTRLQLPAGEFKLANGLREAKLEMSSSKLQAMSPEPRRLLSWDHRLSPMVFQKTENKMHLLRTPTESPRLQTAVLPQSRRPITRELPKAIAGFQFSPRQSVDTAGPSNAASGPVGASQGLAATEIKTVARSFSRESPELLNSPRSAMPEPLGQPPSDLEGDREAEPGAQKEAGEMGKEDEEAVREEGRDASEEPPGKPVPRDLLYPDQLVTEALEDALREVKQDANAAEGSSPLCTDWAPLEEAHGLAAPPAAEELDGEMMCELEGLMDPSQPLEAVSGTSREADGDLQPQPEDSIGEPGMQKESGQLWTPSRGTEDYSSQAEVQDSEAEICMAQAFSMQSLPAAPQELPLRGDEEEDWEQGVQSPVQQDTEVPWEMRGPSPRQDEEQPSAEPQEDASSWEQDKSKQEETPPLQSPEERGEAEAICRGTEPLGNDALVLTEPTREIWEVGAHGRSAQAGSSEEFDRGEEDLEVMSTEALHLSEDEERREHWSPSREIEEYSFQAGTQESDFFQAEIQATQAFSMQSCPALPEENLAEQLQTTEVEGKHFQKTEMVLEGEGKVEMVTEAQDFGISGDEVSFGAEEAETPDKAREGGDEHKEKLEGEASGSEILCMGHEGLRQEEGSLEETGDLQEDTSGQDTGPGEEVLEMPQRQESWGREGDVEEDYCRSPLLEEGEEIAEGYSEDGEGAEVLAQAGHAMTSMGAADSREEQTQDSLDSEVQERREEEDADIGHGAGQEPPTQDSKVEQVAGPSTELMGETQHSPERPSEDIQSPPTLPLADSPHQEILEEPEKTWEEPSEMQGKAATEGDHNEYEEPDNLDVASKMHPLGQGDFSESEDSLASQEDVDLKAEGTDEELDRSTRIRLEETLPDSTPLHVYEGEMLAQSLSSQEPPAAEGMADPAPSSLVSLEGAGQVETGAEPTGSRDGWSSEEHTAGTGPLESTEEEGYFMVSAAPHETPSWEEVEGSEDFEEIQVEAAGALGVDLSLGTTQPEMQENMGHCGESTDEPAEGLGADTAQAQTSKDKGDWGVHDEELSTATVPEDQAPLGEPTAGSEGLAAELDAGQDGEAGELPQEDSKPCPSDTAPEAEESGVSPENVVQDGAQTPKAISPGTGDAPKVSPLTTVADLGEIVLEGQALASQTAADGSLPSKDVRALDITLAPPDGPEASSQEDNSGQHKEDAEKSQEVLVLSPDTAEMLPVSVMKDSDILEIVEQALEFNQELMLGAKLPELPDDAGQPAPGTGEASEPAPEARSDGSDSSSSTDELRAVHEALEDSSPGTKGLVTSGLVWAENHATTDLNGVHHEARLAELAEFTEEILNGISDLQVPDGRNGCEEIAIPPGLHGQDPDTFPVYQSSLPRSDEGGHQDGDTPLEKAPMPLDPDSCKLADILQRGKTLEAQSISVPSAFGDEILHLSPGQPLQLQPKDAQGSWSSEDD
ncbi:nestin [Alligator mississippiensis]|uniref:nestin n=1 Tax=Alligator mississippiensis TaxID=8496 RepID=UPI00287756E4|nr:nestin [Alligator mississippiensis]